jgi:hypothetical protein
VGVVDGQGDGLSLTVQGVGLLDDLFFDLQVGGCFVADAFIGRWR